jgi:hypothetical protein
MSNKKGKKNWKEPEDKTKWLLDLVEAGESVVKGYEQYLLNKVDHIELAKLMTMLHDLLPMSINNSYEEEEEE